MGGLGRAAGISDPTGQWEPVEVLEVGSDEICARLRGSRSVWRDIRREGIVVHGRGLDELAQTPDG